MIPATVPEHAEAGPSTSSPPPPTRTPLKPYTTQSSLSEVSDIEEHIAKQRRSSLSHVLHTPLHRGDKGLEPAEEDERDNPQYQTDPDPNPDPVPKSGRNTNGAGSPLGTEEDCDLEEEIRKLNEEAAHDLQRERNMILLQERQGEDGPLRPLRRTSMDPQAPLALVKQQYAREVIYENQRGIYWMGKGYFSSSLLFPGDPSAFNFPRRSQPVPSRFRAFKPGKKNETQKPRSQSQSQSKGKRDKSRQGSTSVVEDGDTKNNKTIATSGRKKKHSGLKLDTVLPPDPSWEWLEEWAITMTEATDELGWEYNYAFRPKGWKSHSGAMGWGGWVRRRRWERTRGTKPGILPGEGADAGADGRRGAPGQVRGDADGIPRLSDILSGDADKIDRDLSSLVKALSAVSLDREKLDTWKKWLSEGEKDARAMDSLRRIFDESHAIHTLDRQLIYHSSVQTLHALLEKHDLPISVSALRVADDPDGGASFQPLSGEDSESQTSTSVKSSSSLTPAPTPTPAAAHSDTP